MSDLDGIITHAMNQTGVPGVAASVVHGDKIVYAKGFGVRKVGSAGKVDATTVFELASVSKSLASTVVAGVVGQKVVGWDDTVVSHLPGFTLSDPYVTANVTLADMFSHRSGLPDHAGDLLEDLGYDRTQILDRLRYYPLNPFRAVYEYANFDLTAAGQAVANAKGTTWEDLSNQILYQPLGMTSTSSLYADYAKQANQAALHVKVDGKWVAKYTRDADAQSPAGGASSNVVDMAKWMRLQLAGGKFNGQTVIDPDALAETHVPHMLSAPPGSSSDRSSQYCLGIVSTVDASGRANLSHSGAFSLGAVTTYVLVPALDLGIVVLTNGSLIGVPESIARSFVDIVENGGVSRNWLEGYLKATAPLYENPSKLAGQQPPANPSPALPDAAYIGSYASNLYGMATVAAGSGGLTLSLGPAPRTFPLQHWDGNEFAYTPTGENFPGISGVTFTAAPSGQVTSVNVENLNGKPPTESLGVFIKQ